MKQCNTLSYWKHLNYCFIKYKENSAKCDIPKMPQDLKEMYLIQTDIICKGLFMKLFLASYLKDEEVED